MKSPGQYLVKKQVDVVTTAEDILLFAMKKALLLSMVLFYSSLSYARTFYAAHQVDSLSYAIINKIGENPRLFFNKRTFPEIKKIALDEEKGLLESFRNRIDGLIAKGIEFKNKNAKDGTRNNNHSYGFRAAESAFLYHVTGEEKYLQFTKKALKEITDYYHYRNNAKLNINWYVYSRIGTLCAYDWIYPFLSDEERKGLGSSLFDALSNMLPEYVSDLPYRSNPGTGRYHTGFYGTITLRWYMGLVFHNIGIDDRKADELLRKGYADHMTMLRYRASLAGDDGGAATATLEYAMRAYPWAEFTFFHTFQSATGIDLARKWSHLPLSLNYFFWNWFPGDHHAGYGDANHFTNKMDLDNAHAHLSQILHFYGKDDRELAGFAKWLQSKVERQDVDTYSFIRFFLKQPDVQAQKPDFDRLPSGRFFPKMGQVFMRSGSGLDDTYAMFSAGGDVKHHRHYDNNNFIIYKKGFRTVDTGTRPQPGLHLSHYYSRTVAHNCILIHMPGEVMPKYWGGRAPSEEDLPVPNDGGQSDLLGAKVIAFDENRDYVYIASDATEAYHKDKSELVLRQFLFVAPDVFVVFDKIVSTKDEYKKTWLLHTVSKPRIHSDQEFSETSDEGTLFCRTIFPERINLEKIGGKGKQFWSGGRNWALPNSNRDTIPLLGQWRVEVSPEQLSARTDFLHVLHVGDLSLKKMIETIPVTEDGIKGVKFNYNSRQYEIRFFDGKEHGGRISISKNGNVIRQENFSQEVKPQSGLYGG